jgi:hypothetical protein
MGTYILSPFSAAVGALTAGELLGWFARLKPAGSWRGLRVAQGDTYGRDSVNDSASLAEARVGLGHRVDPGEHVGEVGAVGCDHQHRDVQPRADLDGVGAQRRYGVSADRPQPEQYSKPGMPSIRGGPSNSPSSFTGEADESTGVAEAHLIWVPGGQRQHHRPASS